MANFGGFLVGISGAVAKRVMLSLGLGVVSYAGLALVAAQVRDMVIAHYGAISGSVLALLNLIGFGQAVGIMLGAILARAAYSAVSRIGVMSA